MTKVPKYFYTQSAVIPYRVIGGRFEVLLIGSRKNKRWVIPKGVREPELSARCSALREAMEEAGVEGRISDNPVGRYRYRKWGGECSVDVFTLNVRHVHGQWPENHRMREWLSPGEAARRVNEKELKRMIRRLPKDLAVASTGGGGETDTVTGGPDHVCGARD